MNRHIFLLCCVSFLMSMTFLAGCSNNCRRLVAARLAENRLLFAESGKSAHRNYPEALAFANISCVFTAINAAASGGEPTSFRSCKAPPVVKSLPQNLALYDLAAAYADWLYTRAETDRRACLFGDTAGLTERRLILGRTLLAYQAHGGKLALDFRGIDVDPCDTADSLFDPSSPASRRLVNEMASLLRSQNSSTAQDDKAVFAAYLDHLGGSGPPENDFILMKRTLAERVTADMAKHRPVEAAFPVINAELGQIVVNNSIAAACREDDQ